MRDPASINRVIKGDTGKLQTSRYRLTHCAHAIPHTHITMHMKTPIHTFTPTHTHTQLEEEAYRNKNVLSPPIVIGG